MQIVVVLCIIIFAILICPSVFEKYDSEFHDYKQMTLLPWCDNPISTLPPCTDLRKYYPGQRFPIDQPPSVDVYETGNATNPNTVSTWKVGNKLNPVYR